MAETPPVTRARIVCLFLASSLITPAVTILPLVGELEHWSKAWFNPEVGGPWSTVGITRLAPIFGIYFAVRLVRARGPRVGVASHRVRGLGNMSRSRRNLPVHSDSASCQF
jgi:hypothetical protein